MAARDRDTKSLQDKLKVFFNKKGGAAGSGVVALSAELERELGPDAPPHRRLRALRDLTDRLASARLQDGGCEAVWRLTRDLLEEGSGEARGAALAWWRAACEAGAPPPPLRTVLFRWLRAPAAPDDDAPRRHLLQALTDAGRNISCFEEEVGAFLVEWLAAERPAAATVELLQLVTNVVKYNANSLDEDVVHGMINAACHLATARAEAGVVSASLALLEAVVAYSLLPRAALPTLLAALARTVNMEQHCQPSWKLMRYVLGADTGPAALAELARLLRAGAAADPGLLRGAVFYINMALWGPQRLPQLKVSYLAVLPSFLKALESGHAVVAYEVALALQSLVGRVTSEPLELHEPTWDVLLDIVRVALRLDEALEPPNELLHSRLHALLTSIEQLHMAGQYSGDPDALLDLVDSAGHARPEASTMWLVSCRAAALSPWGRDWAAAALALAERYVRGEARLGVRLHTLQALHAALMRHRDTHGEELVERVGVPVLGACALDAEPAVRSAAARCLAELACATASDTCTDLIDLLDKILNRPFDMYVAEVAVPAGAEAEAGSLRAAAAALREVLHAKLPRAPAAHAARALLVLLDHLDHHYRRPALLHHHPDIRLKIFEMLFGLRANQLNWVGFCYDEKGVPLTGAAAQRVRPVCSPFLVVEALAVRGQAPAPPAPRDLPAGACVVPAGRCARALCAALTRETDWGVLDTVLRALPALLAERAVALGRRAHDLDHLASTICAMLCDRGLLPPPALRGRVLVSELHAAALPALAAFAPYHAFLEPQTQQRIVRCLLKYGMVLRRPQPYIAALTMFTLEMRDTMVRMLPEVLLDLSKVSDTKLIASPMLEFLSTLTRLPRVFASFVEDQYMSVFAIVLPYTNPSRYNHYVVSLAHHVIAAWFLKCRLSYRRNFVRFIIHGLHNYIIMPFEEQLQHRFQQPQANEDSSNRQRSSSLGSRRAPPAGGAAGAGRSASASAAFHVELTETCVDLLARYAFTPCSVKPHRSDMAEFLFAGGQSMTWVVGHKLVTVTTSGCLQSALKHALCDRCDALCRPRAQPDPFDAREEVGAVDTAGERDSATGRRRVAERDGAWQEGEERWGAGGAACPCWCGNWAEVRVRSPTGDVAWVQRVQNQMSWEHAPDDALAELAALLPAPQRPRSGSASAPRPPPPKLGPDSAAAPEPRAPPPVKSEPGKEVGGGESGASMRRTQPINIPGSPQRQSSSSTTEDDDLLLVLPPGKARHPVRRSNSSPEMSSSWKGGEEARARGDEARRALPDDMIVLPVCEPAPVPAPAPAALRDAKKAAKKSDMRVSCEAIPEEMSGTSPLAAHPLLLTHHSDPGEAPPDPAPSAPPPAPHHALQKTASSGAVSGEEGGSVAGAGAGAGAGAQEEELAPVGRARRCNTISVMSPARRREARAPPPAPAAPARPGVTPSFVFLQLYHNMSTHPITPPVPGEAPAMLNPLAARPLRVAGAQHERTVKNLDLIPPVETFKVGVLYVGPGQQDSETDILRNEHGSVRYCDFVSGLGTLVSLEAGAEAPPDLFLNLEKGGRDGRYTYVWTDDVMQVLFHVATAMPTLPSDPTCNEKRKYIGNDFVSIVYNDSGHDFNIATIKGQFNLCVVVVEPGLGGLSRVLLKTKDERVAAKFLAHLEPHLVSDPNAALLARQLALHASLASQISQSLKVGGAPYASNALERLRVIKRVRRRAEAERLAAAARAPEPYAPTPDLAQRVAIDDFNDYT